MEIAEQKRIWNKGEVTIIGATAARGKTQTVLYEALKSSEEGKNVLFLSMEERKENIMTRLVSYKLGSHNIQKEDETEYKNTVKAIESLPLKIEEHLSLDISDVIEIVEKTKNLDLLIIDPINSIGTPWSRATFIDNMKKLKDLSRDKKLGVILTAQLNKGTELVPPCREDKIVLLSDRCFVVDIVEDKFKEIFNRAPKPTR